MTCFIFYHRIYFKYIIIIFYIFTIFLNKTNDQTCITEIRKYLYLGTEERREYFSADRSGRALQGTKRAGD
jgi:hypothetical protein